MSRILRIVASLASWVLVVGCNRSGKPIMITLPDGFVGEFRIVKDSQTGQEPLERGRSLIYKIPESGILHVKDDRPFYRWHAESIYYESGKHVTCEALGTTAGRHSTGPSSSESSTKFDGTTHRWRVVDSP